MIIFLSRTIVSNFLPFPPLFTIHLRAFKESSSIFNHFWLSQGKSKRSNEGILDGKKIERIRRTCWNALQAAAKFWRTRGNLFDPRRPWPWRSESGAEQFTEPQTRYSVPRNGSNYLASWTGGKWPWLVGLDRGPRERVLVTTDPARSPLSLSLSPYAKLTRQTFAWIRKWADPWFVRLYLRSGHRLLRIVRLWI